MSHTPVGRMIIQHVAIPSSQRKDLVLLAKAYNNPTRENESEAYRYKKIRSIEILAIDDLGQEPKESIHYGDFVTAAMDIISFRYEEQFCTLVSSIFLLPRLLLITMNVLPTASVK